jgi:hypothetical protein
MGAEMEATYRVARRRYELGRLMTALRRSLVVGAFVALVAGLSFGKSALWWLPVTVLVIVLTEWRGVFLMTGARRGLVAGFASILLPLSVLRPCCGVDAKSMGESCCVMPSACWATGAGLGLAMALLLPKAPEGRRLEAALGMILGTAAVAITRCSMLFLGEAIGLFGGLAAAILATGAAKAWLARSGAKA